MKEKLIAYWERKERMIVEHPEGAKNFFAHAFGALEFAMAELNDWELEDELVRLWNDEWRKRLEDKVYGVL